jgi:hypothetical protein
MCPAHSIVSWRTIESPTRYTEAAYEWLRANYTGVCLQSVMPHVLRGTCGALSADTCMCHSG